MSSEIKKTKSGRYSNFVKRFSLNKNRNKEEKNVSNNKKTENVKKVIFPSATSYPISPLSPLSSSSSSSSLSPSSPFSSPPPPIPPFLPSPSSTTPPPPFSSSSSMPIISSSSPSYLSYLSPNLLENKSIRKEKDYNKSLKDKSTKIKEKENEREIENSSSSAFPFASISLSDRRSAESSSMKALRAGEGAHSYHSIRTLIHNKSLLSDSNSNSNNMIEIGKDITMRINDNKNNNDDEYEIEGQIDGEKKEEERNENIKLLNDDISKMKMKMKMKMKSNMNDNIKNEKLMLDNIDNTPICFQPSRPFSPIINFTEEKDEDSQIDYDYRVNSENRKYDPPYVRTLPQNSNLNDLQKKQNTVLDGFNFSESENNNSRQKFVYEKFDAKMMKKNNNNNNNNNNDNDYNYDNNNNNNNNNNSNNSNNNNNNGNNTNNNNNSYYSNNNNYNSSDNENENENENEKEEEEENYNHDDDKTKNNKKKLYDKYNSDVSLFVKMAKSSILHKGEIDKINLVNLQEKKLQGKGTYVRTDGEEKTSVNLKNVISDFSHYDNYIDNYYKDISNISNTNDSEENKNEYNNFRYDYDNNNNNNNSKNLNEKIHNTACEFDKDNEKIHLNENSKKNYNNYNDNNDTENDGNIKISKISDSNCNNKTKMNKNSEKTFQRKEILNSNSETLNPKLSDFVRLEVEKEVVLENEKGVEKIYYFNSFNKIDLRKEDGEINQIRLKSEQNEDVEMEDNEKNIDQSKLVVIKKKSYDNDDSNNDNNNNNDIMNNNNNYGDDITIQTMKQTKNNSHTNKESEVMNNELKTEKTIEMSSSNWRNSRDSYRIKGKIVKSLKYDIIPEYNNQSTGLKSHIELEGNLKLLNLSLLKAEREKGSERGGIGGGERGSERGEGGGERGSASWRENRNNRNGLNSSSTSSGFNLRNTLDKDKNKNKDKDTKKLEIEIGIDNNEFNLRKDDIRNLVNVGEKELVCSYNTMLTNDNDVINDKFSNKNTVILHQKSNDDYYSNFVKSADLNQNYKTVRSELFDFHGNENGDFNSDSRNIISPSTIKTERNKTTITTTTGNTKLVLINSNVEQDQENKNEEYRRKIESNEKNEKNEKVHEKEEANKNIEWPTKSTVVFEPG